MDPAANESPNDVAAVGLSTDQTKFDYIAVNTPGEDVHAHDRTELLGKPVKRAGKSSGEPAATIHRHPSYVRDSYCLSTRAWK
jgi:hypothetical protein